jgi:hypothetical protein
MAAKGDGKATGFEAWSSIRVDVRPSLLRKIPGQRRKPAAGGLTGAGLPIGRQIV